MGMLPKILIGLAVLLLVFIVVAATRQAAYRVERHLAVAAPAELVFGILNDLHQFARVFVLFGTPWDKLASSVQKNFDGPAAGVGQSYSWSGKDVGKGSLTIEETVPGQNVRMTLAFVAPMASIATCVIAVTGTPTGSLVTWSMAGNHNFIGKAMGLFMDMDKALGGDIEKSLGQLKTVAEEKAAGAAR
ncbi:MAG: SRPBCC family protein [Geminicoccaceae bacterium]